MKFEYYESKDGQRPFENFLNQLPVKDAIKLLRVIKNTEDLGLEVAIRQKWIKKLEDNLYELRSIQGNNIQRGMYFKYENEKFIITHGFSKKSQKTPRKEIKRAKNFRTTFYLNRGGQNK